MIDYFKRNTIGPGIEKPEQSPISLSKILAKEGMEKFEEAALNALKESKK